MWSEKINEYRIIPRLVVLFVCYSWWEFHQWFTQNGTLSVLDMSEWHILGYAAVLTPVVGFFKFYMDSGCKKHE